MERETNETKSPALCRNSCGFFGNTAFEGMCSKCYKDAVKRRQSSSPLTVGRSSPSTSCAALSTCSTSLSSLPISSSETSVTTTATASVAIETTESTQASALPGTPEKSNTDLLEKGEEGASNQDSSLELDVIPTETPEGKGKKRNRCYMCRKKVGLTGFECRCGGLYCGLHRYSDKHNCTFDYKADGREQIAKQNPVIVGEKIKKI